ncbi:recombinase RecT [Streptococcus sp. 20-1249]|uniref:recombinase RecT n=1 Tax=Streptococcus hepaticus TaxID=3349163 RepID=UPI0037487CE5
MANELTQKQVTSNVATRIEAMKGEGLLIAPNYSVNNALSSAYYALKNSSSGNLLQQCSQDSVYNALLEMVTQGLSPAKKQCYFIQYGTDVQLRMSYFGTIKVTKDLEEVKDVTANVVYEGDTLEVAVENGRKKLVKHETDWQNADNPIIAAYCIITRTDGTDFFEIMTKKQIDKSWSKAKTKNVQIDFPDQMAMRTVINRAAKMFINTSNDSDLFAGAINSAIADEYEDGRQIKEVELIKDDHATLDDLLQAHREPIENEKVLDGQFAETAETEPKTAKKTANKSKSTSTEYPAEEIPDFDAETGEILEGSGNLFDNLEDLMP